MKLIQILALAAAMATMATAQNTGANNSTPAGQPAAAKSPTATPTPGKTKTSPGTKGAASNSSKATSQAATKNASPAAAGTTTKGGAPTTVPGKPVAVGQSPATTSTKTGVPATKTGVAATKTGVPASKTGVVPQTALKSTTPAPAKTAQKKAIVTKSAKKPVVKPVTPLVKAATAKPAEPAVVAEKKPAPRPMGANGRRDPFISPIRTTGPIGPNCSTGKRCLSIPEMVLKGTVRDISGKMMAVVVNSTQKTYTLRENDQVFNGSVEKITTDSIIFREFVKDPLGHETAREVVKKLRPPS
jgi:hypothetical protein